MYISRTTRPGVYRVSHATLTLEDAEAHKREADAAAARRNTREVTDVYAVSRRALIEQLTDEHYSRADLERLTDEKLCQVFNYGLEVDG